MAKRFTFKPDTDATPLSVEEMARKYGVSSKELAEIRRFVKIYALGGTRSAKVGSLATRRMARSRAGAKESLASSK